ncbi:prostasin, partial [Nephila pilipes]
MSHDGSSYIKHPTEKERLDHLAFSSFPEDYLPYASGHHHRAGTGKAPPYLVWEERRPRRRRGCCSTTALVSAVALVVAAILAVVAVSVYLGVVTNLFRSPVLSLSGKFRVSQGDQFVEELLNTTSNQFLKKVDNYQTMVENVFLSSSFEPAFIAARIYAFRPGLLVFFRLYLDRRKLQQDDSDTMKKVRALIGSESPSFGALTIDRESVDVDENEEWISVPAADQKISTSTPRHPTRLATAPPNKRPRNDGPKSGGQSEVAGVGSIRPEEDNLSKFSYGQWKPVPIEDSVSPSFGDQRTPPGRGNARLPEAPKRSPNPPLPFNPSNPSFSSNPSNPSFSSNPYKPSLSSNPSNPSLSSNPSNPSL